MPYRHNHISAKLWYAQELGSAELLCGTFADYAYDLHTHDKACFALLTRGAIRIRMRSSEYIARAGDLYAIDAEEPHEGWPVDDVGWSLRTIYVGLTQLRALLGDGGVSSATAPALMGPIVRDPELAKLFYNVHFSSEVSGSRLQREEIYLRFISRFFERHTHDDRINLGALREPRAINLARHFITEHLDERIHLGDIAVAAGLPPFRLFRAFERATGMSPHAYQRQTRIRIATGLIRQGRALCEVAAAAGFADQAHLTRSFRRSLGVTPGAYRNAFRR